MRVFDGDSSAMTAAPHGTGCRCAICEAGRQLRGPGRSQDELLLRENRELKAEVERLREEAHENLGTFLMKMNERTLLVNEQHARAERYREALREIAEAVHPCNCVDTCIRSLARAALAEPVEPPNMSSGHVEEIEKSRHESETEDET